MAKWLTKLETPKLWDGYPFILSAAFGDMEAPVSCYIDGYNESGFFDSTLSSATLFSNQVVDFNITQLWDEGTGFDLSLVSYFLVYIKNEDGETVTDTIRIDVATPCENPLMLMGRNSLGGVLQWMFDYSQELGDSFDNDVKAKRLILSDNSLTADQWIALRDFITLGATYRNSITEFTSTTNKSTSRVGQQIYVVGTDNSKIGVISIPTKNNTLTKYKRNYFEIEIEYPIEFTP